MGQKKIQRALEIFTNRVQKRFKPERILLAGSYARGKATKHSDVDVVIVATSFSRIPKSHRLDALYELSQDLTPDFHAFGLTPNEFHRMSPFSTLADLTKHHIQLF